MFSVLEARIRFGHVLEPPASISSPAGSICRVVNSLVGVSDLVLCRVSDNQASGVDTIIKTDAAPGKDVAIAVRWIQGLGDHGMVFLAKHGQC